jgi:hypothetical protein
MRSRIALQSGTGQSLFLHWPAWIWIKAQTRLHARQPPLALIWHPALCLNILFILAQLADGQQYSSPGDVSRHVTVWRSRVMCIWTLRRRSRRCASVNARCGLYGIGRGARGMLAVVNCFVLWIVSLFENAMAGWNELLVRITVSVNDSGELSTSYSLSLFFWTEQRFDNRLKRFSDDSLNGSMVLNVSNLPVMTWQNKEQKCW